MLLVGVRCSLWIACCLLLCVEYRRFWLSVAGVAGVYRVLLRVVC